MADDNIVQLAKLQAAGTDNSDDGRCNGAGVRRATPQPSALCRRLGPLAQLQGKPLVPGRHAARLRSRAKGLPRNRKRLPQAAERHRDGEHRGGDRTAGKIRSATGGDGRTMGQRAMAFNRRQRNLRSAHRRQPAA